MYRLSVPARMGAAVAILSVLAIGLTACEGEPSTGQQAEDKSRQSNYDKLVKQQPAASMDYSPTRATKNFWIETWNEPGKLSYVYLQNANGDLLGYYVMEGLPVSYCVSLIPPYQVIKPEITGDNNVPLAVPGPSIDGTYSSAANCTTYYGKDATTGAYLEYTAGLGINVLLYDQPLPRQDVQPLGPTEIADIK